MFGKGGEDRISSKEGSKKGMSLCGVARPRSLKQCRRIGGKEGILVKRAMLRGQMAVYSTGSEPLSVLKSAVAVVIYSTCLPLFFLLGHHIMMKYLIRNFDHLGKILAFFGIDLVKE